MTWHTRLMFMILGALLAGQALHWFIGGTFTAHSNVRNLLVIGQCAIGIGLLIWASRRPTRTL
jgi:hypothetical protein